MTKLVMKGLSWFAFLCIWLHAVPSFATSFQWDFTNGDFSQNSSGGTIESIHTTFDDVTNRLVWNVDFSASPSGNNTDGYWLVINAGGNPKNNVSDELAIFYFDGSNIGSPKLTVYNFNGQNGPNSWNDGSAAAGTQAPGRILSSVASTSWINSLTASRTGGITSFNFDIEADAIKTFFSNPGWFGTGFNTSIGVWMHPVYGLQTTYGSYSKFLKSWEYCGEGWLDLERTNTAVPEPSSLALLGLAGVAAVRRRARK